MRFESVVMFCVVFTLNELAEYVRPVPAVVVAPVYSRPFVPTDREPCDRDER